MNVALWIAGRPSTALTWHIAFVVVVIVMRLASPTTADLSYLLLAVFALSGPANAIRALALSWLITMLSPGIAADANLGAIGRYAVIAGAACGVFLRSGILNGHVRLRKTTVYTLLLGIFFLLHSILFSPMTDVSIMKVVSWTLVMITLISGWYGLSLSERELLEKQLFYGLVVVTLVSLPLLVSPLGYLRNDSGFQGILNHPQAFGPTMALLGAWSATKLLAEQRPAWSAVLLLVACMVLVLLSEARTAGVALVLGVLVAVVTVSILTGIRPKHVLPGLRSKRVWSLIGMALLLGTAFAPRVGDMVTNYITKSGRAADVQTVLQAYDRSRGGLVDEMWTNVRQQPLTGIGFGIASNPVEMVVQRDPILGLPVSASIEKGVMPLAVVEELGVFGALFVAMWMMMLLRRSARGGVAPLALVSTILLLNMGESTFFSPGGMGLLSLIIVGWAITMPRRATSAR